MTPYAIGYQDGLESPHDLSVGMTWDDPAKNEAYDHGVNNGQAAARVQESEVAE